MAHCETHGHRYLLVVGTPKSATTSLFRYLAAHPDVCVTNRKETYFFAREFDEKNLCQISETRESFESYFAHCDSPHKLRVEATPYTLYSNGVASKIVDMLPNSTIVALLREPIERLFSDFRFQKQRGIPEVQDKTFAEYVDYLLSQDGKLNQLEVGCYIKYLQHFYDSFGEDRILVLFYEEFKANLTAKLQGLCRVAGIDPEYYTDYRFTTYNKTINVRYEWLNQLRINWEPRVAHVREKASHNRAAYRVFEKMVDVGRATISHINDQKVPAEESLPLDVRTTLMSYYEPYNRLLAERLGRPLPWQESPLYWERI